MLRQPRVIVSDVDGTLCFHEEAHGVRVVGRSDQGRLLVQDGAGAGQSVWQAHDVSTSSYRIYLAEETRRLAHRLRDQFAILLVTGGRPSTVLRRRHLLDFASAFIIENGGVILDQAFRRDDRWYDSLADERACLNQVARSLEQIGWALDREGRTSGIRVRLRDNPGKSAADFAALCRDLVLPPELQKTINLENLDIILRSAGKAHAVRYWLHQHGFSPAQAIGIGDDVNDIEFLRLCGQRHVLAGAYAPLLDEARREGWNISTAPGIAGINEILAGILERAGGA